MDVLSAIDPNLAALLGRGAMPEADPFTQMLLQSINPNAAKSLSSAVGAPDLGPLMSAARSAPPVARGYVQPALAGPQALQAFGFGMAGAAGQPGATGLSAMGAGGQNLLEQGASAAERSIREAAATNQAEMARWEGKARAAEKVLDAQLRAPEMDLRVAQLSGLDAFRNAKIGMEGRRADIAESRAEAYGQAAATRGANAVADNARADARLDLDRERLDASQDWRARQAKRQTENDVIERAYKWAQTQRAMTPRGMTPLQVQTFARRMADADATSWDEDPLTGRPFRNPERWEVNFRREFSQLQVGGPSEAPVPSVDRQPPNFRPPSGEVHRPMTDADYAAIPSGEAFIDPQDGRLYRKP